MIELELASLLPKGGSVKRLFGEFQIRHVIALQSLRLAGFDFGKRAFDLTKKDEGAAGASVAPPVTLAMQGSRNRKAYAHSMHHVNNNAHRFVCRSWHDPIRCGCGTRHCATIDPATGLEQHASAMRANDHWNLFA